MDVYIGIDIGTSSIRSIAFDVNGFALFASGRECSIVSRNEGYAEIDADEVLDSVILTLKQCIDAMDSMNCEICGIGISCHMHSLIAVDSHGNALTPVILWADTRAHKEAEHILQNYDVDKLYKLTGCRVQHPMYPLSKILWLKNNEKEIFESTYKFITAKEYVISKIFGQYIVDYTIASSQGYYNIQSNKWDKHILSDVLEINECYFSEPVECTYVLKRMKDEYKNILSPIKDVPFVVGSGDGILANLGSGAQSNNAVSTTVGTSGAVRAAVKQPFFDVKQRTWCYSFTNDVWVAGGAINNGGIVLKWLNGLFGEAITKEMQDNAFKGSIYKYMDMLAQNVLPGSDGLIFLPCLTGERSPDWNANVRGIMNGLDIRHGRQHIIRAAMEGIMYRMFSVYNILAEADKINGRTSIEGMPLMASGGYADSKFWLQMQADIFNKKIYVSSVKEASALGAAFLAMVSNAQIESINQRLPAMEPVNVIEPDEDVHQQYKKLYSKAMKIYFNNTNITEGL